MTVISYIFITYQITKKLIKTELEDALGLVGRDRRSRGRLKRSKTIHNSLLPDSRGKVLHPSLVSEWVRSTNSIGRHKTVHIHEHRGITKRGKRETEVQIVGDRPFCSQVP